MIGNLKQLLGFALTAWILSGAIVSAQAPDQSKRVDNSDVGLVKGSAFEIEESAVASVSADDSPKSWSQWTAKSPWVFLGDSNTYAGGYVANIEARFRRAEIDVKVFNLGMSSETASGLSETDHPFKRPCVHERLEKILRMLRPGIVFACYGMNDGIYDPPSAERLEAYKAGMHKLADAVRASGALLVILTPPIFEPEPVAAKGGFGPTPEGRYAYFAPYQRYDDVLEQQAGWCLENELNASLVINIRTPLQVEKKRRVADDASFNFSGDGVHFGDDAHGVIARQILQAMLAPAEVMEEPNSEQYSAAMKRSLLLRDAYLSATGKNRPGLPAGEPPWRAEQLANAIE